MKTTLFCIALLSLLFTVLKSQTNTSVIYPNKSNTNRGTDTLYYMTADRVRILLAAQESLVQMQKINQLLNQRNTILDSIAEYSRQKTCFRRRLNLKNYNQKITDY